MKINSISLSLHSEPLLNETELSLHMKHTLANTLYNATLQLKNTKIILYL